MSVIYYLKDKRIMALLALLLLLLLADIHYGIHLGIEFIGGTQIPLTLEHSVNPDVMSSLISTLQQRISTFGLKQVTIQGIGNSEVYVTIPTVSKSDIGSTIDVIEKQGIFQGIVNGKEAINGSAILGGASGIQPTYLTSGGNVTWSVSFYISQQAAARFARLAFGQANKPLYMFLDRPTNAIILINESLLGGTSLQSETAALRSALLFGKSTIPVELLGQRANWSSVSAFFTANKGRYAAVVLERGTDNGILNNLARLNYTLIYASGANMTPQFIQSSSNLSQEFIVDSWPAIGLLSAPALSPGVTNGNINEGYTISGAASSSLPLASQIAFAKNESEVIASVLSGGALPVHVIVGVPITTPPTLGKHFEIISALALLLASFAVGITIVIRYRKLFLIAPIMLTTLAELFIIVSIIGLVGTIDLSAVAGMIAVIGTGVDAQIIITDETLLGAKSSNVKTKLNQAFTVVWWDAILLVIAMLPLLFSASLVQVIGFSESTILGALLGAMITRPAYGAIISRHYSRGGEGA